jgi:hypothetical protein
VNNSHPRGPYFFPDQKGDVAARKLQTLDEDTVDSRGRKVSEKTSVRIVNTIQSDGKSTYLVFATGRVYLENKDDLTISLSVGSTELDSRAVSCDITVVTTVAANATPPDAHTHGATNVVTVNMDIPFTLFGTISPPEGTHAVTLDGASGVITILRISPTLPLPPL